MAHEHGESPPGPQQVSMFCLTCGYVLDGLPSNVCPECGESFDPEDIKTYRQGPDPIVLDDPVPLARLPIGAAVLLQMRLDAADIPANLHHERGGVIGYAEQPLGTLWVERDDEPLAHEIMREPLPQEKRSLWRCAKCGEKIAGQFTACWKCGAERR